MNKYHREINDATSNSACDTYTVRLAPQKVYYYVHYVD